MQNSKFRMQNSNLKLQENSQSPPSTPYTLLPSSKGGFTLLEILVALAISGIAIMAVLQLFSTNLKSVRLSEDYVSAITRAEAEMRRILDQDNLAEGAWKEDLSGGYGIEVMIKDAEKERTQNLQARLLEIDLTIHWTKDARERSFILKTMKVVKKGVEDREQGAGIRGQG